MIPPARISSSLAYFRSLPSCYGVSRELRHKIPLLWDWFLFHAFLLSVNHVFLFVCVCSHFRLCSEHCVCYVIKALDSVMFFQQVLFLLLFYYFCFVLAGIQLGCIQTQNSMFPAVGSSSNLRSVLLTLMGYLDSAPCVHGWPLSKRMGMSLYIEFGPSHFWFSPF